MIVRKKKIKNTSTEISLQISYGTPDVRDFVKEYRRQIEEVLGADIVKQMVFSEKDIIHFFAENTFKMYDKKMCMILAGWCFSQAVEKRFFIESTTKENYYYLSDDLPRTIGRPRKNP